MSPRTFIIIPLTTTIVRKPPKHAAPESQHSVFSGCPTASLPTPPSPTACLPSCLREANSKRDESSKFDLGHGCSGFRSQSIPFLVPFLISIQSVTAFPIVFAAVMGHTTRIVATWKLQKGTQLGTIELLLGSSTFFSTFRTPWMMRSASWLSVLLIMVWVLSPLGGQSSLHILDIATKPIPGSAKLLYMDVAGSTPFLDEGADYAGQLPIQNAVYLSSLLAGPEVKNSSMDLWSNPKLPTLSRLTPNSSGWAPVEPANASYSGLAGSKSPSTHRLGWLESPAKLSHLEILDFDFHVHPDPSALETLAYKLLQYR